MYKLICLSLMGQLLASLILPRDISEKNKNNQKEKKLVQTTSKESYALVRERKKVDLGHDPSRMEMFIECHSKKDENITPSIVEAANYMVMGKEKYGRVHMYGLGVSQSDVWSRLPCRKQSHMIAMEWKVDCEQMPERFNNRLDELKSMFLQHGGREESLSEASSPATPMNHHPQMISTQLSCPFRVRNVVCLKSIMNPLEL
ncbi:hypothetical protein RJ639_016078 [Escallonia herrerae]|uniref:Uncharacterized protein n=1 Tax=Escallonia herrerae TaxID=1293975 RepID=A0AA89ALV8_9ASTE|nr:hypothetical protein RJ639_016078 [Escallonia herrerae]